MKEMEKYFHSAFLTSETQLFFSIYQKKKKKGKQEDVCVVQTRVERFLYLSFFFDISQYIRICK